MQFFMQYTVPNKYHTNPALQLELAKKMKLVYFTSTLFGCVLQIAEDFLFLMKNG